MGFTSSRSRFRTKAYTDLILSVEGNNFSSCVRSVNLIRIVVLRMYVSEPVKAYCTEHAQ